MYVQKVVSGTRSHTAATRATIGIQAMDTSAVVLVTSDSICTLVTRAVEAKLGRGSSTRALLVVQFGNRYGAYNPDVVWKEISWMYVVDSAFNFIAMVPAF